jgi:hypothetical protein
MGFRFEVENLRVDRLLTEWRWLCPKQMELVARNALGDLFLTDESGTVFRLHVDVGRLEKIAESEAEFLSLAQNAKLYGEWFAQSTEQATAAQGLVPDQTQCIGF